MNSALLDRTAPLPEAPCLSPEFPQRLRPLVPEGGPSTEDEEGGVPTPCEERVTIRTASAIIESPGFLPFCASPGAVADALVQWARAVYEGDARRRALMDERVLNVDTREGEGR